MRLCVRCCTSIQVVFLKALQSASLREVKQDIKGAVGGGGAKVVGSLADAASSAPGGQGASAADATWVGDAASPGATTGGDAEGPALAAGNQGDLAGSGVTDDRSTKLSRQPQDYIDCGHKMRIGAFKAYHPQMLPARQPKKCQGPKQLHCFVVKAYLATPESGFVLSF